MDEWSGVWQLILLLSVVAFCASFIDAIAGGGGLMTVPALLLVGIPPVNALAVNKFQSSFGTLAATYVFIRKGIMDWRRGWLYVLSGLVGGGLGALSVSLVDSRWLEMLVPILLIAVAFYFIFSPKLSDTGRPGLLKVTVFGATIAPLIGFYDGIFGPGTGSFAMVGLVGLCGLAVLPAMGFTKLLNVSSNVGALLIFSIQGAIVFHFAVPMAIASVLGGQLGARCAVKVGVKLVKPVLISVCILLAIRLISDSQHPLYQWIFSH